MTTLVLLGSRRAAQSIEHLPLGSVENAMSSMAPGIELATGDGKAEVIRLVRAMDPASAARTMVIFDGEKRHGAFATFQHVRAHVALAIFDDSNLGDGDFTPQLARSGQVWWDTRNISSALFEREKHPLQLVRTMALSDNTGGEWTVGGLQELEGFHFSIVTGCAWARPSVQSSKERRI